MLIQCHTEVALEPDEPVAGVQALTRILRGGATATEAAEFDLNLVTMSARGRSIVERFRPQRLQGADFAKALEILEELTRLTPSELKSLSIMLTCKGFRWRGAIEGSTARVALLDGKSFQRKRRFTFVLLLAFEAASPEDAFVGPMLREVESLTGIKFSLKASAMNLTAADPARATPEERLLTALTFNEVVESVSARVRSAIPLDGEPRLMTSAESIQFRFDQSRPRAQKRIDFMRQAKRWLASRFPDYAPTPDSVDGFRWRKGAPEVLIGFAIDKRSRSFSKAFTIQVAFGLISKRFAPTPERPHLLGVNLFRFFGIAPLSLEWTYETLEDLAQAFESAARLLDGVLAELAAEAPAIERASARTLSEFAGPRFLTAREAFAQASARAGAWAADASLIRLGCLSVAMESGLAIGTEVTVDWDGRLAAAGAWSMRFYSRQKERILDVRIPAYGSVAETTHDAPAGRHFPSDVDHILRDGWIDSNEAIRRAAAAVTDPAAHAHRIQVLSLGSQPDPGRPPVLGGVLRDGMFQMQTWWRVGFTAPDSRGPPGVEVRVPAYGMGDPMVERPRSEPDDRKKPAGA
jgi:hypothetical protein